MQTTDSSKEEKTQCLTCGKISQLDEKEIDSLVKINPFQELTPFIGQCASCYGFFVPQNGTLVQGNEITFDDIAKKVRPLIENHDSRIQNLTMLLLTQNLR